MRAALIVLLASSSLLAASAAANRSGPRLDARFGRRGLSASPAARGPYRAVAWLRPTALAPLPDGRFATLLSDVPPGRGTRTSSARSLAAVVGSDGALDRSFAQDGVFDASAIGTVLQIAADSGGRLLLAGNTPASLDSATGAARSAAAMVVRLSPDGRLDAAFDPTGVLQHVIPPPTDRTARVALIRASPPDSADYALVLFGNAVIRVDDSGAWSPSYRADLPELLGSVGAAPPQAAVRCFAADSRGRAVLVEERSAADAGGTSTFEVVRLDAGGAKDATFGRGGVVALDSAPLGERALALDDADRVVVLCDGTPWRVIRLLEDGARDPSWGAAGDGVRELDLAAGGPGGFSLAVEGERCFVAGVAERGRASRLAAFVARFSASGDAAPDTWWSSPQRVKFVAALEALAVRDGAAWIGFDAVFKRGRPSVPTIGRVLFE